MTAQTIHRCFVFGSNRQGRHGKGAALMARRDWGAKYGQAEGLMGPGLQGYSYGIITKELRLEVSPVLLPEVREGIQKLLEFARSDDGHCYTFQVTEIGCGLAGFTPDEIGPEFCEVLDFHLLYDHVYLPPRFVQGIVNMHLEHAVQNGGAGSDGTLIQEWPVADIIDDMAAYASCFEWLAGKDGDENEQVVYHRYYKDFETTVRMWRAQHLLPAYKQVYKLWNHRWIVPDIARECHLTTGAGDHGIITYLDELERLGLIKPDLRDWKGRERQ